MFRNSIQNKKAFQSKANRSLSQVNKFEQGDTTPTPSTDTQTYTTDNITFSQLRWRTGIMTAKRITITVKFIK